MVVRFMGTDYEYGYGLWVWVPHGMVVGRGTFIAFFDLVQGNNKTKPDLSLVLLSSIPLLILCRDSASACGASRHAEFAFPVFMFRIKG